MVGTHMLGVGCSQLHMHRGLFPSSLGWMSGRRAAGYCSPVLANHWIVSSCSHMDVLYSETVLSSFAQKIGVAGSKWCASTMSGSR